MNTKDLGTSKTHARLSPSSAHRWTKCTPSVKLEELFEDKTSEAAQEGTIAHEIASVRLNEAQTNGLLKPLKKTTLKAICKKLEGEGITKEFFNEVVTPEMLNYCEDYAQFVCDKLIEARAKTPDTILQVEKKLNANYYGKDMFGTTDAAIISDTALEIIDLKYGQGVKVSAIDNAQMMIYALANIQAYEILYNFESVTMTIYQPRMGNISTSTMSVQDLKQWGEEYLKPLADKAYKGEGDQSCGSWCGFCKAKTSCSEQGRELKGLEELKQKELLTKEEQAEIVLKAPQVIAWLNAVVKDVTERAKQGETFEGLKLVEGRSVRKIVDPENLVKALTAKGYTEAQLYESKLITLTAMQKLLGKKAFTEDVVPYTIKPVGALQLVSQDDPRPEATAKDDFNNTDIEI